MEQESRAQQPQRESGGCRAADGGGGGTPRLTSDTLFSNGPVVEIQHQGDTYILRKTRNGKLILTK